MRGWGRGGYVVYDTHLTIASSSSPQTGSNAVADWMGQRKNAVHWRVAHPSASHSETPPLAGGGDQQVTVTQS